MLVLSRKQGEAIVIDSDIEVQVLEVRNGRVRLGIRAPQSRRVVRAEIEFRENSPSRPAPEEQAKVSRRKLSDSNASFSIPCG
ncbi:MAG: carbon storage regulator [Planctomycetaceae bacterium]|nr:carbon storage regulator [Planctomycetaceae bacterium]MCA9110572.1 carbon storage regulator [Planctomycetaceae bacterium]